MNRDNISPTFTDSITEITQIIRSLAFSYNENITHHIHAIDTYNQNMTSLLTILNNILEHHISIRQQQQQQSSQQDYRDFNYYRNIFQPRRNRNRTPSLDLSNLVYLLNIPARGLGTTSVAERPTPLTLTEIAHATRIIRYNENMGEHRCPISLDDFIPNEEVCQIRGCRHYFKPQHLLRWLESHVECPVCRYNLRQNRTTSNTTTPTTREPEVIDLPAIDISMNALPSSVVAPSNVTPEPIRRNLSVSEFLPILENILTSPSTMETTTNLLGSRFSQVLSDIIMEQIPTIDGSNNLLYTIEIPLSR